MLIIANCILYSTICCTAPLSNSTSESSSQNRVKFTPAEDKLVVMVISLSNSNSLVTFCVSLLVLGLDRYENNWHSIIANLLPTKTAKQVVIKMMEYVNNHFLCAVTNSCKEFTLISNCRQCC